MVEKFDILQDIATRTNGDIYLGVVGPVRTGKSTFIKRFMELLVLPNMEESHERQRALDELPQSGSGKTIMTTEPKFIPAEAVNVPVQEGINAGIRLVDCVGYAVNSAMGYQEEDGPRMVNTPWYDYAIPFQEAAEIGTRKVIQEHATIGLVVTTDGTVTDLPRQDYVAAEKRAITDMRATGKPFLVVINSREPEGTAAREVRESLDKAFGIQSVVLDCQAADESAIRGLFGAMLMNFPMTAMQVWLPRWMDALEPDHPVKAALYKGLLELAEGIGTLGRAEEAVSSLLDLPQVKSAGIKSLDLATGRVNVSVDFPESLFYQVLSDRSGLPVESDGQLLGLLTELGKVKREYDRLQDAILSVRATGYGVVKPAPEEMKLEKPEILKKGGNYGVKLRATAPSIHLMRVDIDTEISPMVGDEKQSRELIEFLQGEAPEKLWQSNIFGKSVYEMIQEGLNAKLVRLPEDVREKYRGTLVRLVNEGAAGLVCIIL